jgi:two-component system OmpR family sensor kinase
VSGVEFLPVGATEPTVPPQPPAPPELPAADPERPRPVSRRIHGLGPRSLTARLVTGVVLLVLVLVVAIGTSTYFALKSFLGSRLDQQLQTTAQNVQVVFNNDPMNGPAPVQVYAVALDPDNGSVLGYPNGDSVQALELDNATRRDLATRTDSKPLTLRTLDDHQVRLMTVQVPVRRGFDRFLATVVVGLSTDEEHNTLNKLVNVELVIGAAALAVALLATSWGVSFGLRRLRKVTVTAQEVAAELSPEGAGLERRVDVPDDGSEVGQLADSMNTLLSAVETQFAARLESENRMRQFLADASHELRTPLTSIRGYAELARMQRAAGGDAQDNLSRIESEGTRMSRLVEDLLMLARGDQPGGEPVRELIDLSDVIDEAVRATRAAHPDRRIDADIVPGVHVVGDRDQLLRAVRNLITNAAVHTAADRAIHVACRSEPGATIVQVVDGGPGLPPEEAAHVFERFWRADKARSRARGGSGLGLSIVQSIIAGHGGTVWFDSSVEHGSTVTIQLPPVAY